MESLENQPVSGKPERFLVAPEAAELIRESLRSLHEKTRRNAIPHRVLPHGRRCLFVESELLAWMDGAELEVLELKHGGRIVRPKSS